MLKFLLILIDVMCLIIIIGFYLFYKWRVVFCCSRYWGWLWWYLFGLIGIFFEVKNSIVGCFCNFYFLLIKDYVVFGIIMILIYFNKYSLVIGFYFCLSCWWYFGIFWISRFEVMLWFCFCRIFGNFFG